MTDYSQLSDFEINKRVGIETGLAKSSEPLIKSVFTPQGKIFNPCNSWADAGPIIAESGIGLRRQGNGLWVAAKMGGLSPQYDKNPLRAAMIVYLLIKESESS